MKKWPIHNTPWGVGDTLTIAEAYALRLSDLELLLPLNPALGWHPSSLRTSDENISWTEDKAFNLYTTAWRPIVTLSLSSP